MASTITNLNTTELSEQVATVFNGAVGNFKFATVGNGEGKYWGDTVNFPYVSASTPVAAGTRPVFQTDGSSTYTGKPLTINQSAIVTVPFYADQRINEDELIKSMSSQLAFKVESDLLANATVANFGAKVAIAANGNWASVSFVKTVSDAIKNKKLNPANVWAVLDSSSASTLAEKHGAAYTYGTAGVIQDGILARLFGTSIYNGYGTLPVGTTVADVGFITDGTALGLVFGSEKVDGLGNQIEISEASANDVKLYISKHTDPVTKIIWLSAYTYYATGVINPNGLQVLNQI